MLNKIVLSLILTTFFERYVHKGIDVPYSPEALWALAAMALVILVSMNTGKRRLLENGDQSSATHSFVSSGFDNTSVYNGSTSTIRTAAAAGYAMVKLYA